MAMGRPVSQHWVKSVSFHSDSKGFYTFNAPQMIITDSGVQQKQIKMMIMLMVNGETVNRAIQVRTIFA